MATIDRVDVYLSSRPMEHGPPRLPGQGMAATPTVDDDTWSTIACVVTTSDGAQGSGYGWSIGERRGRLIAAAVKETAEALLGCDAMRIEAAWDVFWRFSNLVGHSGLAIIGMSVIDMALWDIRCRAQDEPLWIAIGGHKDRCQVYSNGLRAATPTVGDMTRAAEALAESGHRMVKTAIFDPKQLDALRGAVANTAPEIRWGIDIIQVWDVSTAIRAIKSIDDLELFWVEDPVPYDDVAGLADVAASVETPICSGENAYYIWEPQRLVAESRIRYLSLDLMRCGGITGWRKIAGAVEGKDVRVVSHTYPQVAAHLVCGTRNATFVEHWPQYDGIVGPPIEVEDGWTPAPSQAGIGVEFSKSALETAGRVRVE